MTRRLSPRHRRTRLGRGGGNAAGVYEQCDHRTPTGRTEASAVDQHGGSLIAYGLLGRPGRLGRHVLRSFAGSDRLSDFDARTVAIADLLSFVRLDAEAEVIMWHCADGERIVTSIARLFDDVGSELVLGGVDLTARPVWSETVTLRSAAFSNNRDAQIVAFTAMTFSEFIGGRR